MNIAGTVTFKSEVTVERITEIASKYESPNHEDWVHMYVVPFGTRGLHDLHLHLILADASRVTFDRATQGFISLLRKELGVTPFCRGSVPKGIKCWNLSNEVLII